jgi:hypothetical protein
MTMFAPCYVTCVPDVSPLRRALRQNSEHSMHWTADRDVLEENLKLLRAMSPTDRVAWLGGLRRQCESLKTYTFLSDALMSLVDCGLLVGDYPEHLPSNSQMRGAARRRYQFHVLGSVTVDGYYFDRTDDWARSIFDALGTRPTPYDHAAPTTP